MNYINVSVHENARDSRAFRLKVYKAFLLLKFMKIHLPNSAWIGNIDPFLRSFESTEKSHLDITSHHEWVSVHPCVLCMIVALGLAVQNSGGKINYQKMTASSKHYFERIGVFKLLNLDSEMSVTEHEPSGRFIELTRIKNSEDLNKFITNIIPLLHSEPEQVEPIKYVISELVRNVFEHSYSKDGALVCAQFYNRSKIIRIGVVDIGIGIKKSINNAYPEAKSDLFAIKLALTPGVTGTTKRIGGTESNAGAGLFFIKSIAKVNRDFFMIYSGNTMYKLLKSPSAREVKLNANPFEDRHSKNDDFPYWNGTAVGIDIALDNTEDFSILLDLIRKTYSTSVRERRRGKYKKPKFV